MFEHLIKLIRQEKVSLFIGSGFSLKAGAPSACDLVKTILDAFPEEERNDLNGSQLSYVANEYVQSCSDSRNELIALLNDKFNFVATDQSDHKLLSRIPHFRRIFTTNYDTLLEDNYPKQDRYVVRNDVDCACFNEKSVVIFKIHGDLSVPNNMIITKDDYDSFPYNKSNPNLWGLIQTELLTKHVLFIGYSLEDYNIISLIKQVRDNVGPNQKEMFLIAPGIIPSKRGKLSKQNVRYYDAKAEDFLIALTADLKMNIAADFKSKKVTAEVFTKFCRLNDFYTDISLKEDVNSIGDIHPEKGRSAITSITFTTDEHHKNIIQSLDFGQYGKKDNPLGIPMIEIPVSALSSFDMSINDVRLSSLDEISKVVIGPSSYQKGKAHISVDEFCFYGEVSYTIFSLNKSTIRTIVDTPLFEINIDMPLPEDDKDLTSMVMLNLKPTFKPTYNDHQEALHWIKLVLAIFKNTPINISSEIFKTTRQFDGNIEGYNAYCKYEEFYKNIAEIEKLSGVKFKKYENYTNDSYVNSQRILSYLKKEPLLRHYPNGQDLSFTLQNYTEPKLDMKNRHRLCISTTIIQPLVLNDAEFNIPYVNTIHSSCEIASLTKNNDDTAILKLHDYGTEVAVFFSDNPIKQEKV